LSTLSFAIDVVPVVVVVVVVVAVVVVSVVGVFDRRAPQLQITLFQNRLG